MMARSVRARGRGLIVALMLFTAAGSLAESPRTTEVVRRDCRTTIGGQEVTLFANGTLRLRRRQRDEETIELAELEPGEVEALNRRLADEDLSEVPEGRAEVRGDWVEQCTIHLQLAGHEPREFHFGRFDSLPLTLARLNRVVDDMVQLVVERAPVVGLPRDYVPRSGDILERADGVRFRVIGFTSDQGGVELTGVDQPLTLFIPAEDLKGQFVSVVERRQWP